jgi:hypothetical protein
MGQEIDDAMSEHADETGHRRFIEHRRQRKEGTDDYERMQTDRHGMQHRVMQERMECRSQGRLRHVLQIMRNKAQG